MQRVNVETYNKPWMLIASAFPLIGNTVSSIAKQKLTEALRVQGHPPEQVRMYHHIVANYETAAAIRNGLIATMTIALIVLGIASGAFTGFSLSLIVLSLLSMYFLDNTIKNVFSVIEYKARAQPQRV